LNVKVPKRLLEEIDELAENWRGYSPRIPINRPRNTGSRRSRSKSAEFEQKLGQNSITEIVN
jgi:hypothetical protein